MHPLLNELVLIIYISALLNLSGVLPFNNDCLPDMAFHNPFFTRILKKGKGCRFPIEAGNRQPKLFLIH